MWVHGKLAVDCSEREEEVACWIVHCNDDWDYPEELDYIDGPRRLPFAFEPVFKGNKGKGMGYSNA